MQRIRKGDEVIVITGRDKGKKGTVTQVHHDGKVTVEGINIVKKHVKPNPKTGKGDRVGFNVVDGKKVRVFKSDGSTVGATA